VATSAWFLGWDIEYSGKRQLASLSIRAARSFWFDDGEKGYLQVEQTVTNQVRLSTAFLRPHIFTII
jgi:hypothetical protein